MEEKVLKIRPYARLLTMLGDQLIKNEIVALTELVKNAYDADSDFCDIDFDQVSDEYVSNSLSAITISDNGYGMSYNIIANHFLNPATPVKKTSDELRKSKKGRICQGEKGIGRFSMLKLGKKVTIYSKEDECNTIHKVVFDFEAYDNEFLSFKEHNENIYLDDLKVYYSAIDGSELPQDSSIMKYNHGTIIHIEHLKGEWDKDKIKTLKEEFIKLSPLEINDRKIVNNTDFIIRIYKNKIEDLFYEDIIDEFRYLVWNKALYKIQGKFVENKKCIQFTCEQGDTYIFKGSISLKKEEEPINDLEKKLWGLSYYKKDIEPIYVDGELMACGSFGFEFYIFDFAANQDEPFGLSKKQKDKIREHRVFLYRDKIRVQPYGAADDDWLRIDQKRAISRANEQFSNDQMFGQIMITKKGNPNLKDKTSREGLIESGKAFEQLTAIVRTFLSLIRTYYYQPYRQNIKKQKQIEEEKRGAAIEDEFSKLEKYVGDNKSAQQTIEQLRTSVAAQKETYIKRLDTAESLAAVGISVEASSHDIMLSMNRLKDIIRELKLDMNSPLTIQSRYETIQANVETAESLFALVYMKMQDMQQLFVSSKQRPKLTRVEPIIKKIQDIYSRQYKNNDIEVIYNRIGKSPVTAKLIDAVLYQVFINLFDNALYWLQLVEGERKVVITLDGDTQSVIFSDNGYGVLESDQNYIFEPFYSGKGEDGRGMGLYIARKLLGKNNYSIELITENDEKIERGANFRVSFISEFQEGIK